MALVLLALVLWRAAASTGEGEHPERTEAVLSRIAFGSCNNAERQGLWGLMHKLSPDRLVLLGDNMYADRKDALGRHVPATEADLRRQYALLDADAELAALVAKVGGFENVLATYDDHDFGVNDADRTYPLANQSRALFLDFFRVPADAPRRTHQGVYSAQTVRLAGGNFTYKVVLLDVRFNKDPYGQADGDFLGAAQWAWLAKELAEPVDLLLLGSSIQVLPQGKVVEESWSRFPRARERLLRLLLAAPAPNLLLLSGDIHTGEVLTARCGDRALVEFTASGLTHTFTERAPLKEDGLRASSRGLAKRALYWAYQLLFPHFFRQTPSDHYQRPHLGLVDVQLGQGGLELALRIVGADGRTAVLRRLPLRARDGNQSCALASDAPACEPFWGPIPQWRLRACVVGLWLLPVLSIGGPLGLALRALALHLKRAA